MKKVIVGMSGGTDSTVAAALLQKKGYEVIGLTLTLWDEASRCCNIHDIMDAKMACSKLGIRHYTINAKKEFKAKIVDYFTDEYLHGRTPNPCVVCNDQIKFKFLIQKMKELDYDYVATGHYCKIGKRKGVPVLKRGLDENKTQEYFLAGLEPKMLNNLIFPLGGYTKTRVKQLGKKLGVKVGKKESQEVCFLKDKESPYEFINRYKNLKKTPGSTLVSPEGKVLKKLDFAYYKYTLGQRKGLGYSSTIPMYVVGIDANEKRVVLGEKEKLYGKKFSVDKLNLFFDKGSEFTADVKIRYLQKASKAKVKIGKSKADIEFAEKQFAITPGQLAVFYEKDTVIGSGFII